VTTTPTASKNAELVTGTANPPTLTLPFMDIPETHMTLPSGLRIDEYALKTRPTGEPLVFEPIRGSREEILAKHATERQRTLQNYSCLTSLYYEKSILLDGKMLIARQIESGTKTSIHHPLSIEIVLDGKTIYRMSAGVVDPSGGLQRLCTYGKNKHWAFEVADVEVSPSHTIVGKVVQDGKLLNEQFNNQEMFGFQVFQDKPFYFFKRNDYIGISYDGQETLLDYADVPHYNCCSLAVMDPDLAQNMVAFFARKHGAWYYVEIGVYQ